MIRKLAFLAFLASALPAAAQTPAQVITGYPTGSGCPSTNLTPCFVPYGGTPSLGAANTNTGQVSVGTSATLIAAARTGAPGTGRVSITLTNTGANAVFIGGAGVAITTGLSLAAGASITLNTTAAVYGIVATTAATVTFFETF